MIKWAPTGQLWLFWTVLESRTSPSFSLVKCVSNFRGSTDSPPTHWKAQITQLRCFWFGKREIATRFTPLQGLYLPRLSETQGTCEALLSGGSDSWQQVTGSSLSWAGMNWETSFRELHGRMWKAQVMETAWILQRLMHPGEKVNQGFRRVLVLFANESKWSMYVSWMLMSGSFRQGEWWGNRLFLSSGVDTILSPTTWISQQTGFGTDHSEKPQLNHRRGCTHRERIGIQNNDHIGQVMEKAMAPHSSTLARKIPWMEEPGRLQTMGSWTVRQDWATSLSLFSFMHWRRKWQPTPVFLAGESQGRGSLVGRRLWGRTESDTTEPN